MRMALFLSAVDIPVFMEEWVLICRFSPGGVAGIKAKQAALPSEVWLLQRKASKRLD